MLFEQFWFDIIRNTWNSHYRNNYIDVLKWLQNSSCTCHTQRTHDVIITPLLRQNDVATSFRRNNGVIIMSCAHWAPMIYKCFTCLSATPPPPIIRTSSGIHLRAISAISQPLVTTISLEIYFIRIVLGANEFTANVTMIYLRGMHTQSTLYHILHFYACK